MAGTVRRTMVVAIVLAAMMLAGQGMAAAGPKAPPNFGVQNPQQLDHCWHPDPVKCFTTGWADGAEVHIVADPIEPANPDRFDIGDEKGIVTFWCQSNIGFKYQIWVSDLEPKSTYTVSTIGAFAQELGTFRTDPQGYGVLNGLLKLDPGGYYVMLQIKDADGTVVYDTISDGQGFSVFG